MFLKILLPLFSAVALAVLAQSIRFDRLDVRANLAVVALFAAVSSQAVVNSTMPASSEPVFADFIHLVSFLTIVASIFFMMHRERRQGDTQAGHAHQEDCKIAFILDIVYVAMVGVLCLYY